LLRPLGRARTLSNEAIHLAECIAPKLAATLDGLQIPLQIACKLIFYQLAKAVKALRMQCFDL
jgi:hypothetical protein